MAMKEKPAPIKRARRPTRKIKSIDEGAGVAVAVEAAPEEEPVAARTRGRRAAETEAAPALRSAGVGRPSYRDVTDFLRQLIMLLEAGTPIMKALRSLAARGKRHALRRMIGEIADYVEGGHALWQAFDRYPRSFDTVFVNLVKASEASGTLVTVLQRIVENREEKDRMRKRIRSAMMYPTIVILVCIGIVFLFSFVVVPTFLDIFAKMDIEIRPLAMRFINVLLFIGNVRNFFTMAGALIGVVVLYKLATRFMPGFRLAADRAKLWIPIMGSIEEARAVVELTQNLALLLRSGMSMLNTIDLTQGSITNRAVARIMSSVRDSVEQGGGFEEPLRRAEGLVPAVVTDMLATGEEAGQMDAIAEQVSRQYEEELRRRVATLGEMMMPVVSIILGFFVLATALAFFLPLIEAIQGMAA